jgi:hypothetical protein
MTEASAARPASEILNDGLAYWQGIRGGKPMPSRADLDPLHIPHLLPHVILVDVLREPLNFRYRLIGSLHDRILGSDHRGRLFSDLAHTALGTAHWDQFARVVAERQPLDAQISYVDPHEGTPGFMAHCLMPLSSDGESVDIVFVVGAIAQLPDRQAPP